MAVGPSVGSFVHWQCREEPHTWVAASSGMIAAERKLDASSVPMARDAAGAGPAPQFVIAGGAGHGRLPQVRHQSRALKTKNRAQGARHRDNGKTCHRARAGGATRGLRRRMHKWLNINVFISPDAQKVKAPLACFVFIQS